MILNRGAGVPSESWGQEHTAGGDSFSAGVTSAAAVPSFWVG